MNNGDIDENSIIVKHIPPIFTVGDCEELFSIFKCKSVIYFNKRGPMQHTAIVSFNNHNDAYMAVHGLHERKIMNSRLCAQFLKAKTNFQVEYQEIKEATVSTKDNNCAPLDTIPNWITRLLSVATKWGLDAPIQPGLRYNYPQPNNVILSNIVRCLLANENFYTQTLHLMNKFHFPVPFTSEITFPGNVTVVNNDDLANNRPLKRSRNKFMESTEMDISSSNESEISDDEHYSKTKKYKLSFPKIQINPASNYEFINKPKENIPIDDIFEKKDCKSNIAFRPISSLDEISDKSKKNLSNCVIEEGFGKMKEVIDIGDQIDSRLSESKHISLSDNENPDLAINEVFKLRKDKISKKADIPNGKEKTIEKPSHIISTNEIKDHILSQSEWESVNALKHYKRGTPSNQLYIKNISKKASKDDLISLYAGFVDWSSESEVLSFQVTHFTEGRMKGQAFVSFESQFVAEKALEATNAFILLDKPISVQFSKSAHS